MFQLLLVCIVAWYRYPSDPITSVAKLETFLSFLDNENEEIILFGDKNCDLTKRIENQAVENPARHMSEVYDLFSLKHLIQEPTRVN